MREILLVIHRWIGLTAGIIFGIAAFTGGLLVYEPEIDRMLFGPRITTTPGLVEPERIVEQIRTQNPGATLVQLDWPGATHTYRAHFDVEDRRRVVMFDAGSGTEVRPRGAHPFFRFVRRLHVNLLVGRPGGLLVLYSSAAALIAMVLGIYLWWPGIRRFYRGFRIRLKRDLYIVNFDLHQVLGILALPLLLALTLTGVLLPYPQVINRFADLVQGPEPAKPWTALRSTVPADSVQSPAPLSVLAANAMRAGGGEMMSLVLPSSAAGIVTAKVRTRSGETTDSALVALDQYSGEPLGTFALAAPLRLNFPFAEEVHFARAGGPVLRALFMLSCFAGAILLPTGVIVWWIKRSRKLAAAEQRQQRRPMPQPELAD